MVKSRPPAQTDVAIVGGGPAGLAAAIALRLRGFAVMIADRAVAPIEKACGEGLMPDGVAALRRFGIDLGPAHGVPFIGIRFVDNEVEAQASFSAPHPSGLGIRRTRLHRILAERAQELGVVTCWHSSVDAIDSSGIFIGGSKVSCGWIIGADGFHSRVREWTGLSPVWSGPRRIGWRQHFRVEPWSNFVEVHWHNGCQAYVTPIAADQVCVALVGAAKTPGLADLPVLFPRLGDRLRSAQPLGTPRGAISMSVRLGAVTHGRIALVGDASGSVDAVTGEGLALAFRQAECLASALAADDLDAFEALHRRTNRLPRLMARALLLMDGREGLRRRVMQVLAAHPVLFNRLLAVQVGAQRISETRFGVGRLAARSLGASMALRRSV